MQSQYKYVQHIFFVNNLIFGWKIKMPVLKEKKL